MLDCLDQDQGNQLGNSGYTDARPAVMCPKGEHVFGLRRIQEHRISLSDHGSGGYYTKHEINCLGENRLGTAEYENDCLSQKNIALLLSPSFIFSCIHMVL